MKPDDSPAETGQKRRRWQVPELKSVGTVGAVLQGGGGKLSPAPNDPGEGFKPPGQG